MAFPDTILASFPADPASSLRGRTGMVSIEDLAKLVMYHSVRRISVSSENFGLVDVPKIRVRQRVDKMLIDKADRLARLQPKHPGEVLKMKARIHLTPPQNDKTSWTLYIHLIGTFVEDTDQYYPVL